MLFRNIGIIDEDFKYRQDMTVGVQSDRITYIGEEDPADAETYGEVYDGKGKVMLPGFYNAHGHSPMCLMRGYGENLALQDWLYKKIFPFEDKLYRKAVYWATMLTMAESFRFGIVSTSDMYFFIDDMVRAYSVSGAKANISRAVSNPSGLKLEECAGYKEARETILMYDGFEDGRIKVDVAPHAEYTNDVKTLTALADTAREFDVGVHVHLSETRHEADACIERYGKTPTELMDSIGLFDQPAMAAHCVWLSEGDIEIIKEKAVTVASNPASNFKLASGICDVATLYDRGIRVAIGTDSVASNNSLNFIEQIKLFALAGKVKAMDPAAMTPRQVIYSATRAGALAQGRQDSGLIKEDFKADIAVLDVSGPNMQPVHDMLTNIVYSADGADICMTMIDGRVCYRDGEYTTMDINETMAEADKAREKILSEL